MSQKGLADLLSVSQGSVSKWEAGKESPRAETVERIRELSGIKVEPEGTPEQEETFEHFCEVPYQGSFIDGLPYSPFNAENVKTLMVYLKKSVASQRLEAWAVSGRYPNLPRNFIGIFQILDEVDRSEIKGHPARNSRILTHSIRRDGTVALAIEEVNGDERMGYWLWPLDRRTRSKSLPVRIRDEMSESEGASATFAYGVLVAVLYEPTSWAGSSNL